MTETSSDRQEREIEVLDPSESCLAEVRTEAPRLRTLERVRIGLIDNTKVYANEVLTELAEGFERYGVRSSIVSLPEGRTAHAEAALQHSRWFDAVIAGVGT